MEALRSQQSSELLMVEILHDLIYQSSRSYGSIIQVFGDARTFEPLGTQMARLAAGQVEHQQGPEDRQQSFKNSSPKA